MSISAIIITKNEEEMLPACLRSLSWVDEIIVVDSQSKDKTVAIAKKHDAKVVSVSANSDYSTSRNQGKKATTGDWLFYVDADERVPSELQKEIQKITNYQLPITDYSSYKVSRKNIMLGKWLKHGGFWPDYVDRLFHKNSLIKWTGKLHESPTVKGETQMLKNPLRHYTARSINSALTKSAQWAEIEAKLLHDAHAPKVTWWRVIKAFNTKLFGILIRKKGFLDGIRGLILAYIQALHVASILVNLWQLQKEK